MVTTMEALST